MLKEWVKEEKPNDEELSERLEKARAELSARQMAIKEKNLPVLVVMDGWGAAGKGSVLGRIIKNLDPRFFKCETLSKPTEEETFRTNGRRDKKTVFISLFCQDSKTG